MKICLFADGESIHTIRWCNYFLELGHEVHLISFKNVTIPNVSTYFVASGDINVKGGNWKVLLTFPKVKKLLKKIQPDVFHAHYATSYGITGALCNFHPFVITTLGSDILISPNQSKPIKILLKWALKRADWITSMADHMTLKINELIQNKSKITTLPFGIDTAIFNEKSNKELSEPFTIVSTRNFEEVYNIPHLIKAFSIVKIQIPDSQLILIGAGSLKTDLEKLVEELNLQNNVTFKGKLTQTEIAEELNKSHLFVTVSKSDGNNISLNEAMACGTICIATRIPANVQWIEDKVNGFLVDIDDVTNLADSILTAHENYSSFQEIALPLNRKIIAEKANWYNNMSSVISKYSSLIKQK